MSQSTDNNRAVHVNPPPADTIPKALSNAVEAVHFAGLELIQLGKVIAYLQKGYSYDVFRMLHTLRKVESELMGLQGLPVEVAP